MLFTYRINHRTSKLHSVPIFTSVFIGNMWNILSMLFRCLTSVRDDIYQSALLCLLLMKIHTDMMWDS